MARWLNLVEVSCFNTSQEREYLDWYEKTHLSDILGTPGYISGRLFRAKESYDGRGQFLTMYDIETEDIDKTIALRRKQRVEERARGRYCAAFTVIWRDVLWRLIAERTSDRMPIDAGVKWVNLWETYCADPSREREFCDWYDTVHLVEALEVPGLRVARWCERKEFVGGRGAYLEIYEFCTGDIDQAMSPTRDTGRRTDLSMDVWRDLWWKQLIEGRAKK